MTEKILYLDAMHNIVPEDEARWKVIHKYDEDGELVEEVWVDLKKEEPE